MLLFLERAARAAPLRNVALAGLSFGLQCLGGHPQVALMSAALGVGYALVRLWPPRMSARDLARPVGLVAVFVAIGAGISAVYYLPMAELARQSVRPEGGLSYARAVTYALPLPHLATAVSPFLFFDASTGAYQGAWNHAEMALYAGLPTLVLAGIALWSRPRDPLARFFAAAALIALLLALGDATPLHGLLHTLAGLPRPSRSGPLRASRRCGPRRARGPGARLTPERGRPDRDSACPPPPGAGRRPRGLSALRGAALARPAGAGGRRLARRGLGPGRSRAPGRQGVASPALAGLDRGLALATAADGDVVVAGGRRRARGRRPLGLRGDVLLHALGAARHGRSTRRRPRSRGLGRPRPHLRRQRAGTLAVGLGPARRPRRSEPRRLRLAAPRPPRPLHARVLALGPDRARAPRCRRRHLGRRFLATSPRPSLDARRRGVQPAASPGRARAGAAGARGPLPPGGRGRGSDPARDLAPWSGGGPPGRRGGASDDRGDDGATPHLQAPRGPRHRGATSRRTCRPRPTRAPPQRVEPASIGDRRVLSTWLDSPGPGHGG